MMGQDLSHGEFDVTDGNIDDQLGTNIPQGAHLTISAPLTTEAFAKSSRELLADILYSLGSCYLPSLLPFHGRIMVTVQ